MNKKSLLNKVEKKSPFSADLNEKIYEFVFSFIRQEVKDSGSFEVKDFGVFKVEHRDMTSLIDYKLKAEVLLPPKNKVVFIASELLTDKINGK